MVTVAGPHAVLTGAVASDPSVRSDGAAVAVTLTAGDLAGDRWIRRIHVVGVDGADRGISSGPADRHPRFAPVGAELLFVRPDNTGVDTIVRWPDGGAVAVLDEPVRGFVWSPDGQRIAAVLRRVPAGDGPLVATGPAYKRDGEGWRPTTASLVVVDVATGAVRPVLGPLPAIGDVTWTADGAALLVTLPHDPASWRWDLHRVDVTSGALTPLTDHGDWDRVACPVPVDGGVVYVGGESGPRHAQLLRLDDDRVSRRLAPDLDRNVTIGLPAYPGAAPVVADGVVLFTANDRSVSRLFAVPAHGGAASALTDADVAVQGLASGGGTTVMTAASARRTSTVEVVGGPTLWAGDDHDPPWSVEVLDVVAPDGAVVPCWLLRSVHAGDGPAPTLLDLHGGPHNVSAPVLQPGNLHRWLLAERGWHVLLPNVRGSDGYGEQWYRGLEHGGGWASTDVEDVRAVVAAAVRTDVADADRLAIHGYSYGGLLVAALTSQGDLFRAAAMGGAPVDLHAFVSSSDLPTVLWNREVGGLPWAPTGVDERSPITRVGQVRTPTLIVHGTADQRVPVSQGEQWFQGLQAHGVPSELALYPDAPHGFVTAGPPATVADVGRRVADWLLRWTT